MGVAVVDVPPRCRGKHAITRVGMYTVQWIEKRRAIVRDGRRRQVKRIGLVLASVGIDNSIPQVKEGVIVCRERMYRISMHSVFKYTAGPLLRDVIQ